MRAHALLSIACAAALATAATAQMQYTAQANSYCNLPGGFCNSGGNFTLAIQNVPTSATGTGTLQISTIGDYSASTESFRVTIEGLNLGVVLNNNGGDDRFNFPNGDAGQDCASSPHQGTATLTEAELNTMIADGTVTLTFDAQSSSINDFCSETMDVTLSFTPGASAVPASSTAGVIATIALVLIALGLGTRRGLA
jgi:hypothetical protein